MIRSTFNHARARETARRLREGKPPVPMFAGETVKRPGDIVITNVGSR